MKLIKIGQRFGMLEVISLETSIITRSKGNPSQAHVICRCDCGEEKTINKGRLFRGDSKTCGGKECTRQSFISTWQSKRQGRYGLTSDGYSRVGRNGKQVLVHRLIMEDHLGRKLGEKEVVHHLNGIKTDNRIVNLVVLSGSTHSKQHSERLTEISLLRKKVEDLEIRLGLLERENLRLKYG